MSEEQQYQPIAGQVTWKLHFASSPEKVYQALVTSEGRKHYWAESAEEINGEIHYVFHNGVECKGAILEQIPNELFSVIYFDCRTTFTLQPDGAGGTDLQVVMLDLPEHERMEVSAGWVSWLMAMKAYVDFGIDLRNHDPKRTWFDGFVEN